MSFGRNFKGVVNGVGVGKRDFEGDPPDWTQEHSQHTKQVERQWGGRVFSS